MKVLMLVNWKVRACDAPPEGAQPADYRVKDEDYWFFRYFEEKPEVDIIDVRSFAWLERFEKNKLHLHVVQGLRAIARLNRYDMVVSHGMTSAAVVALWRRFFKTKAKHVVFDIGCFNSAAESGAVLRLMQFVSHSLDRVIYHTGCQKDYYASFFPWLSDRADFMCFGVDGAHLKRIPETKRPECGSYILCIDSGWRDRETLIAAYRMLNTDIRLRFVGRILPEYANEPGVEQIDRVPFDEMVAQIDNALFCVLPLEVRNFSYGQMTLLDQMARGKCVVAAAVPSLVDYARDGESVLFYRPQDVKDCAGKLRMALEDRALLARIGQNARRLAQETHTEENMGRKIEAILRQTVGAGAMDK